MTLTDTPQSAASILDRYQQAQRLLKSTGSNQLTLNDSVRAHWIDPVDEGPGECFWYQREYQDENKAPACSSAVPHQEYRLVNASTASHKAAFDHSALASALSTAAKQTVDARALPIEELHMQLSAQRPEATVAQLSFVAFDQGWTYDCAAQTCIATPGWLPNPEGLVSPNGLKTLLVRDHNLWLRELSTGEERALTTDGTADCFYGQDRFGFAGAGIEAQWSPDSNTVLTHRLDRRGTGATPIAQYVPLDGSLRPQCEPWHVSYPGDEQEDHYQLLTIDVASGAHCLADYRGLTLWGNGMGFFTFQKLAWWGNDSRRVFFVDVNSKQQTVGLVEFDTSIGATRVLFDETAPNFLLLHLPIHTRPTILPLIDSDELIWLSQHQGSVHLFLYDLVSGKLKHQLTEGDWSVDEVVHIDPQRRQLLIQTINREGAAGEEFYRDLCWLHLDSGELITVAKGLFENTVIPSEAGSPVSAVSPSGDFIVLTQSRVDRFPESILVNRAGEPVMTLDTAEPFALPEQWQWPEAVTVRSADGQSDIYGVVFRPPGFDPKKSYPVLDYSIARPAYDTVPRASFSIGPWGGAVTAQASAYAALGFVVVMIDGAAQPYRRRELQRNSDGRFASAFGFADRIAAIQQLAERDGAMDLNRVGIASPMDTSDVVYAMLDHPEFYRVGVSHDFEDLRFMASSWTAVFDGFMPKVAQGFELGDAELKVDQLQGKLLLIHNMLDSEPPVTTTLRLADALQEANKDYDLILLPKVGHADTDYATQRTWNYFVKHLLNVEPPKTFCLGDRCLGDRPAE